MKPWFRSRTPAPAPVVVSPEEGRPLPDSGLAFTGWYRSASETLATAARDGDPRCVKILCVEAAAAIAMARDFAMNDRQRLMCDAMGSANNKIREIAESMPIPDRPHTHDPAELIK